MESFGKWKIMEIIVFWVKYLKGKYSSKTVYYQKVYRIKKKDTLFQKFSFKVLVMFFQFFGFARFVQKIDGRSYLFTFKIIPNHP